MMKTYLIDREEAVAYLAGENPAQEHAPLAGHQKSRTPAAAPVQEQNRTELQPIGNRSWVLRAGSALWAALAIALSLFASPLRAQFAYVANAGSNTVSAYSIGADGSLTPVPGSGFAAGSDPFSVAVTPLVPFASSFAKLEIESELSTFHLSDSFTLGTNSNGITPTTQKLTLQIGTFSVTIPSGSFKKTPTGTFICKRTINGVSLNLKIVPLSANMFTFNVNGSGIDLGGLTEPVTVVLTIGIDSGTTKVAHYTQ